MPTALKPHSKGIRPRLDRKDQTFEQEETELG